MNYLARVDSLDYGRSLATPVDARVALLTGQSSFTSSRLLPGQLAMLRGVGGATPLELGFPYHPEFDSQEPEPDIVRASVRNARQFIWSLRPQPVLARALQPLFSNTRRSLSIVTGSCGLQLLQAAWPFLERPGGLRWNIVALGPAALLGSLPVTTIQGRRDYWSRLLYRGPVTRYCDGGHLDYWTSPEVHDLVRNECI